MLLGSLSPLLTVAWPALDLNFARDKALPGFATITGQNGTVVDASGDEQAAITNAARFDHSNAGASLGLLIEASRAGTIPTVTTGRLGHNSLSLGALNGTLAHLRYFNRAGTDAEIDAQLALLAA